MSKIKELSLIQITPTLCFPLWFFLVFPLEILDKKNFKIFIGSHVLLVLVVLLEIAELPKF
jgi:hypothetical protein